MDALRLWGPIVAGAVAATLVGLILGRPLNFLLGWSFRAVQPRLRLLDQRLHAVGVGTAARQRWWCWWSTAACWS